MPFSCVPLRTVLLRSSTILSRRGLRRGAPPGRIGTVLYENHRDVVAAAAGQGQIKKRLAAASWRAPAGAGQDVIFADMRRQTVAADHEDVILLQRVGRGLRRGLLEDAERMG